MGHIIREENRSWQHMTCLIFSVNWVIGVRLLHHQLVKTCLDFGSVFRQLLSGARTQLQLPGSYEMQEYLPWWKPTASEN
jgi:hypothetical protein